MVGDSTSSLSPGSASERNADDRAAWPPEQTISDTLQTYALLAITNTGSLNTSYRLEIGRISGPDGAACLGRTSTTGRPSTQKPGPRG